MCIKKIVSQYLANSVKHDTLEQDGILDFNAINREPKEVEERVDLPNEYHMGINRYYQEDLDKLIAQTDYEIIYFHKEDGKENNKRLVYVLKKQKKETLYAS